MKRKTNIIIITSTVMILLAVCAQGRVFFRWGASAQSTRILKDIGGRIAYETRMNINGNTGQVTVFGFNQSLSELMQQLRQSFRTGSISYSGGNMGTIILQEDDILIKLVAIEINGTSVIFRMEQHSSKSSMTTHPLDRHLMTEIPPFPDSTPVFYAKDENTQMGLAVSKTTSHPGAVREFYQSVMTSEGWSNPMPVTDRHETGMSLYLKDNLISGILVENVNHSQETRITLLHKLQDLK